MKLDSFHGNLLGNFKEWGYMYKDTHVSAATHAKTLNLVLKITLKTCHFYMMVGYENYLIRTFINFAES